MHVLSEINRARCSIKTANMSVPLDKSSVSVSYDTLPPSRHSGRYKKSHLINTDIMNQMLLHCMTHLEVQDQVQLPLILKGVIQKICFKWHARVKNVFMFKGLLVFMMFQNLARWTYFLVSNFMTLLLPQEPYQLHHLFLFFPCQHQHLQHQLKALTRILIKIQSKKKA